MGQNKNNVKTKKSVKKQEDNDNIKSTDKAKNYSENADDEDNFLTNFGDRRFGDTIVDEVILIIIILISLVLI